MVTSSSPSPRGGVHRARHSGAFQGRTASFLQLWACEQRSQCPQPPRPRLPSTPKTPENRVLLQPESKPALHVTALVSDVNWRACGKLEITPPSLQEAATSQPQATAAVRGEASVAGSSLSRENRKPAPAGEISVAHSGRQVTSRASAL